MLSKSWVFSKNANAYDLVRVDRPLPDTLSPHSVRVQVKAVSLNYRDIIAWKNLAGRQVDNRIPASDGAGEIIAVGSNVQQWKVGDRVAGCFFQTWQSGPFDLAHHKQDLGGTLDGMLQSVIDLPETGVVETPPSLSIEQASTLPCAGLTAWYSLFTRGGLVADQTVLCIGTGGVSIFALQFSNAIGARAIVLSSSDSKLERARAMGAWQTINYREHPQWADEVWKLTDGHGVDHVVEVGGPGTLEQSMNCVAASGHIALIGVLTGFGAPNTSLFPLLARNVRLNGIYVGSRDKFVEMNAFIEAMQLKPTIDQVFSFDNAPSAFEYLQSAKHIGKVVIAVK
jgi:NADPH:quinone reductase-like Zn-dependent oxidoreductase